MPKVSVVAGTVVSMNPLPLILCTLLALLLGAVIGYMAGLRRCSADGLEPLRTENSRLSAQLAGAEAGRDALQRQMAAVEQRSEQDQSVLRALAPVQSQLVTLESQVRRLEQERAEQFGSVREALLTTQRGQEELRESTLSISSALRSTTARGSWGEAQLRRVVEAAGMNAHIDYSEQVTSTVTGPSGTQTLRPDMVVFLPGGKEIVLDAKAPLDAYLESQEAESESEKAAWETRHAKAVQAHVKTLAGKRYWEGRPVAPEIVLCFLPMESALSAALRADAQLLDFAASRGVALVSPVSLLASLKAVALSWKQENISAHARELLALSRQLCDRLAAMGGHLQKMGQSLTGSVEAYNRMLGSIESRVLVTARRIHELDLSGTAADDRLSPHPVEQSPRPLTAPELTASADVLRPPPGPVPDSEPLDRERGQ